MLGWYEIHALPGKGRQVVLKDAEGRPLLHGVRTRSDAAARAQIERIRESCMIDERYDIKTSATSKWYFYLTGSDQTVLGVSPLAGTLNIRDAYIGAIRAHGGSTSVRDYTKPFP
ncbi:MAG TPA: hypothetical protein VLI72_04815 [Methylibium sp.]|nr:hypothetical protein [Methylibium sp.]